MSRKLVPFVLVVAAVTAGRVDATELLRKVSVGNGRAELFGDFPAAAISGNGRFVAFVEYTGPSLSSSDVLVRDRLLGTTTTVFPSYALDVGISADGRYVAAYGYANTLVRDTVVATTAQWDVDRFDVVFGFSADGRHVAVSTSNVLLPGDTNGTPDVYVKDLGTDVVVRASVANDGSQAIGWSDQPALSADGRFVLFRSTAENLVTGDTNGLADYFVRDLVAGTTVRVNVATGGAQTTDFGAADYTQPPAISDDGHLVAFVSQSAQLVPGDGNDDQDAFVHDLTTGETSASALRPTGRRAPASS